MKHAADGSTGTNQSENMAVGSRFYFHSFQGPESCKRIGFNCKYPDVIFVHLEENYVKYLPCKSITSVWNHSLLMCIRLPLTAR